jgi:hypothetical protein
MKPLILVMTSWIEWLSLPSGSPIPRDFLFWKEGWRVNFWHVLSVSWVPLDSGQLVEACREGLISETSEENEY